MTKFNRFYVALMFTTLFIAYTPILQAEMQQSYGNQVGGNRTFPPVNDTNDPQQQTFGQKGNNKALNAFANLTTSTLEIPKNIINTMNQSNFFYGVFGGFLKGLVNTLGRTGCGIVDFITLPLPTQPIVYPAYVWDDFDVDTSYGQVFRRFIPTGVGNIEAAANKEQADAVHPHGCGEHTDHNILLSKRNNHF